MKLVKSENDVFRTIKDNIKSLNKILKDWCNKTISYELDEDAMYIDINILKDILTQVDIPFKEQDHYVPGLTEIYWDEDNYALTFEDSAEYLGIKYKNDSPLMGYALSVTWSSSNEFISGKSSRNIVLSKVIPREYYIVEWKDLNMPFIKSHLESIHANSHTLSRIIDNLSRKYPYLSEFWTYIPIFHESFLELSDPKRFILYEFQKSVLNNQKDFQWRVMDFSQPMILEYDEEEETYNLLIPTIYFIIDCIF